MQNADEEIRAENADNGSDLVAACAGFRAGTASVDSLRSAVMKANLYLARPIRPGVFVTDIPGHGCWAQAFSSLGRLAEATDSPGEWYCTSGLDLIGLLPAEVGLLIDPNNKNAVALQPAWL